LQLDVAPGTTSITTPVHCQARAAGAGLIDFEVGPGLADPNPFSYPVDARWNRLPPHLWDGSQRCMPLGPTSFDIAGSGLGLKAGGVLLIDTKGPTSADPSVREVVVIARDPDELFDPILGVEVTRVELAAPTTRDHDLTRTTYSGNLVPATQGLHTTET